MALYDKFFYNGIMRKLTIAFGSLFTNIYVTRKNESGFLEQEIVPITFSPKEKFVQRIMSDPDLERKTAIKLPHLAFEIANYQYDPERKLSSKRKLYDVDKHNLEKYKYVYTPVPYNIFFDLSLVSKTQEEGLQIIEQILPFFTPDYVLTLKLLDMENYKQDIPISLLKVSCDDKYEGDIGEKRTIVWTLSFVMKAYLIGPERGAAKILHTKVFVYAGDMKKYIPAVSINDVSAATTTQFGVIQGIDGSIFDLTTSQHTGKIDVPRGQTYSFTVEVMNEARALADLTGFNTFGRFRKNFSHPGVYPIATVLGQNIGTIDCTVDGVLTAGLDNGLYVGELSIENPQTLVVNRVVEFILNIK